MQKRCPNAEYIGVAKLKNWQFQYSLPAINNGSKTTEGNIIPKNGSYVWGVVFDLDETDVAALDYFEYVPNDYLHKIVEVEMLDGGTDKAYAYIHRQFDIIGVPSQEYMNMVIRGAEEANIPEDYIDRYLRVNS